VNSSLTNWDELVDEVSRDRRSGKRLQLSFVIEITGFDRTGRLFTERTKTVDISEFGCRFDLHTPVKTGNVVALRLLPPSKESLPKGKPSLFEVMWSVSQRGGWTVGTRKVQNDEMWNVVTFPPTDKSS
jgi:hypothetical protein